LQSQDNKINARVQCAPGGRDGDYLHTRRRGYLLLSLLLAIPGGGLAGEIVEPDFEGSLKLPSAAAAYNVAPGILLAADVRDANPQGMRDKRAAAADEVQINLQEVKVRAKRYTNIGPGQGLALTREEIPGNVQSLSAEQIKNSNSLSIGDLMNSQLQSVSVNDYAGNPFQMDVNYRGFTASPQLGTSQGLSVFLDGIRVNEPFGDVVNWDMIPMNALASLDVVPGSNPLYGQGTLGGAITMRTKNGFENAGVEAKTLTGSFGRKQFLLSAGANNGVVGGFVALNLFDEEGWRDNSPSKVNQGFVKLDYRSEKLNLGFSTLIVGNDLVGNGTVPKEMYKQNPGSVFSSPDETKNRLEQFQLFGEYFVNDVFTVTGQVYRRKSGRQGYNGDINEDFETSATRRASPGERAACGFPDLNGDGLPDYSIGPLVGPRVANGPLTPEYEALFRRAWSQRGNYNQIESYSYGVSPGGSVLNTLRFDELLNSAARMNTAEDFGYFTDGAGQRFYIFFDPPVNNDPNDPNSCAIRLPDGRVRGKLTEIQGGVLGDALILPVRDSQGLLVPRDGAGVLGGKGTGYVEGTPNALITKTAIDQVTDGSSLQLNWNLDKHKLLLGASVDSANAAYEASQLLTVLDANRHANLNPGAVGYEYFAARNAVGLNDFSGTSITRSLFFSETWSPVESVHVTAAGRFNHTKVKNVLEVRKQNGDLGVASMFNSLDPFVLCPIGDPSTCADPAVNPPDFGPIFLDGNLFRPTETEKFTYRSFNPAVGATWQAQENLNVYGNWNRGARVPSVIELGCAIDDTPVNINSDPNEPPVLVPRSIRQNRFCSLPSTLAGDPYLKQVRSETLEFGARGQFNSNLSWNASVYRTDLQDDIYFVSFRPDRSFFQNIGATRRQGFEMGLSGKYGRSEFRLNYSLTDATFQDEFEMASPNNSSADPNELITGPDPFNPGSIRNNLENPKFGSIKVKPGSRMPGIPLQNLNATVTFSITPKWRVGLTMIAHSETYARGNENNEHRPGPATLSRKRFYVEDMDGDPLTTDPGYVLNYVERPDWTNKGFLPGYATFNFSTSYDLGGGWILGALVNNLFDKEYYSAGRLALNPFSPSINGAIGVSGFNFNSNEWRSTNSIAPAAPRAIWFSLSYEFQPGRK
jgi:iron complex outermembrane receptor protein